MSFPALVTRKQPDGVTSTVEALTDSDLPDGDVTVEIEWSGVNYKDGLCVLGQGGLVRNFPHVAGIDFAGRVIDSGDGRYRPGQNVVLTGWRVGEVHWGGFAGRARVKADWLVPLPEGMSSRTAMVIGTAGLTAQLAISRLQAAGMKPGDGEVLVTGAGGGVGSVAVMILSRLGFAVAAVTGRPELATELTALGARTIVPRDTFLGDSPRVLESERWAGVVDSVAGPMLGRILKQVKYGGSVAAIGLAGGPSWEGSIVPFILRGVSLIGIDSVMQPYAARVAAWERLTRSFDAGAYEPLVSEIGLGAVPDVARRILSGQVRGRTLVDVRR